MRRFKLFLCPFLIWGFFSALSLHLQGAEASRVYISQNGAALEANADYTLAGTATAAGIGLENAELLICLAESGNAESAEVLCAVKFSADGSATVSQGFTAVSAMRNVELLLILNSKAEAALTNVDIKLYKDGSEVQLPFSINCGGANASQDGQSTGADAQNADGGAARGASSAATEQDNAALAASLSKAFEKRANVIFVSKDHGKDTYSGRSQSIATPDGPKQTLSGAISAAQDGDTVILQGASGRYAWPAQNSISGKTIAITANGNAAIGGAE